MPSRLNNLLPPLMHPVAEVGAEGEEAFRDYAAALTRQMGLLTSALITLCILVWWPLDWALMPDAQHIDAFFQLRASAATLMAVAFVALWTTRLRYAPTLIMATGFYAGFLGCIGLALGRLGVMGWLGDAYLGIVPMALIPMRLRWRIAATSLVGLTLVGGFFGPFPAHLGKLDALGQLSFMVFAVLFTIAVGENSSSPSSSRARRSRTSPPSWTSTPAPSATTSPRSAPSSARAPWPTSSATPTPRA